MVIRLVLQSKYRKNRKPFETLSERLALYSSSYENLIIVGDFNLCVEEFCMLGFCNTFALKIFIKVTTCSKNPENASSIDFILANSP